MARGYDWNAPAKLFFWPAADGSEEDAVYPTLAGALSAAGEGDAAIAWIVTQAGDILSPRLIQVLREERRPRQRAASRFPFGWARAA